MSGITRFILKLLIVVAIIPGWAGISRRRPELAGLMAAMPLTVLPAMRWLYTHLDRRDNLTST